MVFSWNPWILPTVYTCVGAKFNRFFIILGGVAVSTRNFIEFMKFNKFADLAYMVKIVWF